MIRLVNIYDDRGYPANSSIEFLFELMKQRPPESNISHQALPTWDEHMRFVNRVPRPFRFWYLIHRLPAGNVEEPVGYISATENNEIGIVLLERFRANGYGPMAINMFIANHHPLEGINSKRTGHWLANIAPGNEHSKRVFTKLGFEKVQETYQLKEAQHVRKEGIRKAV